MPRTSLPRTSKSYQQIFISLSLLAALVIPLIGWPQNSVVVVPMTGDDLVVPRGTNYVVIPAASFTPVDFNTPYQLLYGAYLESGAFADYVATVPVPHGATIDKFTVNYADNSNENLSIILYRLAQQPPLGQIQPQNLSTLNPSTNTLGVQSSESVSILHPLVDLLNYSYFAYLSLPMDSNVLFQSMRVDYSYGE